MSIALLATKLHFPQIHSELVSRPRLVGILEKGLHGPLTLISAPAGSGKTTLMLDWRVNSKNQMPLAWLSLDSADNDLLRFMTYLTASIELAAPNLNRPAIDLLQSSQLPALEIITASLAEWLNSFTSDLILALDDYHLISNIAIHNLLNQILAHLPPALHLVILTRADPSLPLARLRVRNQLTEIRVSDLRFTVDEVAAFLTQTMGLSLTHAQVASLEARTEGWIAGLQLAALSMQGRRDVDDFVAAFTGSNRFVVDYLIEEVLSLQSKKTRDFLLKTSILERMSAPLCNALTGESDGQAMLAELERANLFVVELDLEREWYRYHHLFADMLRNRLKQMPETEVSALHRNASAWFANHQLADEAITHALAAHDLQGAALLVEQHALDMLRRGEIHALKLSIQKLPQDAVQTRPWLCLFTAWGRYHYGPREETIPWVEAAERALQAAGWITEEEKRHIASFMAAIRAFKALHDENFAYALEMVQMARAFAPEWDFVSRLCSVTLAEICRARGDITGAEQAMHQAVCIALKLDDIGHAVSGAGLEALHQIKQARLHDAYRTLNDALGLAALPNGGERRDASFVYIRLADLVREWNDLERAAQYINRAVELLTGSGSPDYLTDAFVVLARVRLAQKDLTNARQALEMAQRVSFGTSLDPAVNTWLKAGWVRLWLDEENFPAMKNWADHCGLTPAGPFSYSRDLEHINLARVWLAQALRGFTNHIPELRKLLDNLQVATDSAGWINETIEICILKALMYQGMDDKQKALNAISQALTLAEPAGYIRLFLNEGAPMARLVRLAGSKGIMPKYVHRLCAAFENFSAPSALPEQALAELLSERELEVLRLIAAGAPNKRIANDLVIAIGTVKRHTVNIFNKLGVENRTEAVAKARELRIL